MLPKKKLQVFVSSTYIDLKEERQAAVEAILAAGHIPAGMELFAAGDQSQMNVIKRWINESDVFLLILGGRYGSIEPESKKSYIQLEYEYALEQGKPLFAVVIKESHLDEKVRLSGRQVIETENPNKLKEFRALVLTNHVEFWSDPRDIQLAIHKKMSEYNYRDDLIGWIPGDQAVNTKVLAEEMARLTKENAQLREQLAKSSAASVTYNGLTFDEMYQLLSAEKLRFKSEILQKTADIFGDSELSLIHILWLFGHEIKTYQLRNLTAVNEANLLSNAIDKTRKLGLIKYTVQIDTYTLTECGHQFFLRLMLKYNDEEINLLS